MSDSSLYLIVVGAASHSPALFREMEELAARLGASLNCPARAAWYDQGRPALADALATAVSTATRIVVVPYLLQWRFPDHFSLPAQLQQFSQANPGVAIHLAAPLGLTAEVEELLHARVATALAAPTVAELGIAGMQDFALHHPLPKTRPALPLPQFDHHVLICQGRACLSAGATDLEGSLREAAKERGMTSGAGSIRFTRTRCLGPCAGAPVIACYPDGDWYHGVAPTQGDELIAMLAGDGAGLAGQRFKRE